MKGAPPSGFTTSLTDAEGTLGFLSPRSSSEAHPVLLREVSLSADNIPVLCLNDTPMATTPPSTEVTMAMQPLKPPSEVTMANQPSKPPSEVTMAIQPSSSLHTATHQMMSSPDNTDNSAFFNQDKTDIPPNETAPAIYCGECPIPEFMTPITTLSDVTSAGVRYENVANDFTLEVP